jgi:glycosyltransferase involved in cell wall biosynthesis
VINEALATGLPCVVSDRVGAAPDLISPGTTGDVFAMGDIAGFAASIERVRDRECAAGDRGRAGRQAVTAGSLERATAGLLDACRAVARRPPRRGRVSHHA